MFDLAALDLIGDLLLFAPFDTPQSKTGRVIAYTVLGAAVTFVGWRVYEEWSHSQREQQRRSSHPQESTVNR